MIKKLEFKLSPTTSYEFLIRYARVHCVTEKVFYLAQYLIELTLGEIRMIKYTPSNLAASALYLACKIEQLEGWNDILVRAAKYTEG